MTTSHQPTARFDFRDQLAVVTGASRGIGAALTVALAEAGATVIGVARNITAASPVAQHVSDAGGRLHAVPADLSDRKQSSALAARVLEFGAPNMVIHCAGVLEHADAAETSMDSWDRVLEVNLNASFLLARDLGRSMLTRGSGKVIFVGSMLSYQGGDRVVSYTASKTAIRGVTAALATAWAPHGINVNAVAPGYIVTDNTAALLADGSERARIDARIPAGRWGEPQDVVGAVLFLASSAADYIHGVTLPVDGGWLVR